MLKPWGLGKGSTRRGFINTFHIYEILSRNSIEFAQINSFAAIVEGFLRNKLIKADKLIRVRHRNDVLLVLFSRLIILRILNPLWIMFYIKFAWRNKHVSESTIILFIRKANCFSKVFESSMYLNMKKLRTKLIYSRSYSFKLRGNRFMQIFCYSLCMRVCASQIS